MANRDNETPEEPTLTPEIREELERRLEAYDCDPRVCVSGKMCRRKSSARRIAPLFEARAKS
jgi:hypothetical protein